MNVTIKDIAKAAGVSHPTVSRALNNHPAISEATRERIVKLAKEMGYQPNASARGLKTNRTHALGVIMQQIDDPFWSEVLDGVDSVLHPERYSLFIASTHNETQREDGVVQAMVQRGVDGVILFAPQFRKGLWQILNSYDLPVVMVNNEGAGECQYFIYNDDVYGARLITKHLIDLGHTRLAYLGKRQSESSKNRLIGFRTEMQAAGLPLNERYFFHTTTGNPAGGREGAEYLLSIDPIPSAIMCYNDFVAVGVYNCLQEKGLQIPQDVSVTGFDNITIAKFLSPPLTTLHQHKFQLGEGAARMMLEVLSYRQREDRESMPSKKVSLKGVLKIRKSTDSYNSR
ncbi:MAG: LacI family transcriptional regulator [Chloroflexi bacterium]|nr:LacI family transcriptional regulator [Chloroflexota bacterium]